MAKAKAKVKKSSSQLVAKKAVGSAKKRTNKKAAVKAKTQKKASKVVAKKSMTKASQKKKSQAAHKSAPKKHAAKPRTPAATSTPTGGSNVIWKLLEARKQKRESQNQVSHEKKSSSREGQDRWSDQNVRFGRFAGPRRRAA